MSRAGAGDNNVRRLERRFRAIRLPDLDLGPVGESRAGPFDVAGVNVEGDDLAAPADDLRQNGGVIARSAAEVNDGFPLGDRRPVERGTPKRRAGRC